MNQKNATRHFRNGSWIEILGMNCWRVLGLVQCLRRYRDDRDKVQLWNAGKYASTLIALAIRTRYVERGTTCWLVMFIIFSISAMLYQLYWDLVIDWGLLQRHSQNPWLRDQLILKKKYLYFISMVEQHHQLLHMMPCVCAVLFHYAIDSTFPRAASLV